MVTIKLNDVGAAVEDIQERLVRLGFYSKDAQRGLFDLNTARAIENFCISCGIEPKQEVNDIVWARLVDETFEFGDRNLYLRVPFFHGQDVKILQTALSALGFSCGSIDGIFGAHTEQALRSFQFNMGLPSDGIAGGFTFRALNNLSHSWKGKSPYSPIPHLGFARAAEVLEKHVVCLFGITPFTRSVAARMSNLALATNPTSQLISADTLLVAPVEDMLYVQILVGNEDKPVSSAPVIYFDPIDSLSLRIAQSIKAIKDSTCRIAVSLPSTQWQDAGEVRSAQHYAIILLDAICSAFLIEDNNIMDENSI